MALIYLRVIQSPGFAQTISTMPVMCLPALNVLLGTQNFILLEEVLRTLAPLKPRFLPLETLLAPFEEELEMYRRENCKHLREQQEEEDERRARLRFCGSSKSSGNFSDGGSKGRINDRG